MKISMNYDCVVAFFFSFEEKGASTKMIQPGFAVKFSLEVHLCVLDCPVKMGLLPFIDVRNHLFCDAVLF